MAEELKIKIVGEIPEGAERSSVRARFAPDAAEDVQGQGWRHGLAQTEDEDAEGQGIKWHLKPAEDEDAKGNMPVKWHLGPVGDDEAEGNALRSHVLEIERNEEGELVGRFVPAEGDDTEGQIARY